MVQVYLISKEKLGDRDFNDIPVAELQLEVNGLPLEDFQTRFNLGQVDSKTEFIRFVAM